MSRKMMNGTQLVRILYTNWKGEENYYVILPGSIRFGSSPYHLEPQWLLKAWVKDKQDYQDFAMKDIKSWDLATNSSQ